MPFCLSMFVSLSQFYVCNFDVYISYVYIFEYISFDSWQLPGKSL